MVRQAQATCAIRKVLWCNMLPGYRSSAPKLAHLSRGSSSKPGNVCAHPLLARADDYERHADHLRRDPADDQPNAGRFHPCLYGHLRSIP